LTSLLDVNVLIALVDRYHVHNRSADRWFAGERARRWATCPLTQNGVLRIVSGKGYENGPYGISEVAKAIRERLTIESHEFWPDDVSLLDESLFRLDGGVTSRTTTDVYLLGLAVRHDGCLVTFDRNIPLSTVVGAEPRHLKVVV